MSRYQAIEGSQSGHCCFEATVVDTTRPSSIRRDAFVIVCECFDFADAEEIARALNARAELELETVFRAKTAASEYQRAERAESDLRECIRLSDAMAKHNDAYFIKSEALDAFRTWRAKQ